MGKRCPPFHRRTRNVAVVGGMKTKKAQKAWLRAIKDGVELGRSLRTRPDYATLLAFARRHPKLAAVDIRDIVVKASPAFDGIHRRNRCFWVVDGDGREISASYAYFVSPNQYQQHLRDPAHQCKQAARQEVTLHALAFKKKAFRNSRELMCAVDNTPVAFETSMVDHGAGTEFKDLLEQWLASERLHYKDVRTRAMDVGVGIAFVDREMAARWRAFHNARATYRITSHHGNLVTAKQMIRSSTNGRGTRADGTCA